MKPKSTLRTFLAMAGSTLLTVTCISATTYYWDGNDGTVGFQNAHPGPAGTWTNAGGLGTPSTATGGFTTDSTGATVISANPNVTTTTADTVYIGTNDRNDVQGPSLYAFTGPITIDGTVDVGTLYVADSDTTWAYSGTPIINFAAAGTFQSSEINTLSFPAVSLTGAGTSMTWKVGYGDNLLLHNFDGVTFINGAARNIITGPGRVSVNGSNDLGVVGTGIGDGTPLTLDGGTLRMIAGITWLNYNNIHAEHPLTFTPGAKLAVENRTGNPFTVNYAGDPTFTVVGAGGFESEGTSDVILDQSYAWTGPLTLSSGRCSIEQYAHIGTGNNLVFNGGYLKIRGNTISNFTGIEAAGHPISYTGSVGIEVEQALHTFTVDKALTMGAGSFNVSGDGTVVVDLSTSNYTGTTNVATLATLNASNHSLSGATTVSGASAEMTLTGTSNFSGLMTVSTNGTLNLNGNNSGATGGVTSSATLNLNSATALGTGTFTWSGGTLNNSISTLTTTHPIVLGGSPTWAGTTNLTFGSGPISINASRTITLNGTGSTLTFGGLLTNTQAGNPTLTATGAGNTLVIGGGLALSGPTDASNRTVTISGTGNVTINGAVTSGGNGTVTASLLTKTGTGTLTLNGNNTYDGLTTHSTAGSTLTLAGDNSGAAGGLTLGNATAVLNINHDNALGTGTTTLTAGIFDNTSGSPKTTSGTTAIVLNGNTTYSGTNNLTLGGPVQLNNTRTITLNGAATLTLANLVNTQAGNPALTVTAGTGNNLVIGGLDLSNTSTLRTVTVQGTANTTVTGAVRGSSFAGSEALNSNLTKSGTGTLKLQGNNTYTGATAVNTDGELHLASGSQASAITVNSGAFVGFTLGSTITSTAALNLQTGHKVRIHGTPVAPNSYTLINAGSIGGTGVGTPTLESPITDYALVVDGTALKLNYTGVTGTAYQTWATGNEPFDGDANGDGVKDGLAFLLGAATPATNATGLLPTTSQTGGNLVMEFDCLATADRGTATLKLEYDGNLAGTWLNTPVPGAVGDPNPIVVNTTTGNVSYVATANGDLIHIVATISDATESASGKLFGRLKAEEN